MSEQELLPCPCCGGDAEISLRELYDLSSEYEQVSCKSCDLSVPLYENGKVVGVTKWNTRTDTSIRARVKELEIIPKVCGNCIHGKPTSLDDTRCYKNTPYIATGRHCKACDDWEPSMVSRNLRATLKGGE